MRGFETFESGPAMQGGARLGSAVHDRVGHAEKRGHHRFGARIPEVAVVLDNRRINFDVPIRDVDVPHPLNLPKIEFVAGAIHGKPVAGEVLFQVGFRTPDYLSVNRSFGADPP